MTKEEILKMAAGNKLDAQIARGIFGKQIANDGIWKEYVLGRGRLTDASGKFDLILLEPYSTDISAAWQVVEKIRTIDTYIEISNGWQPEQFWRVKLTPEGIDAWGRTLPEAICKAALLAKLED